MSDPTPLKSSTTDPAVPVKPVAGVPDEAPAQPIDPDATSLAADVPLLLLPVRIETRFVSLATSPTAAMLDRIAQAPERSGDAGTLLVRVYPDTIGTSSFEAELTAEEITAGSAYWRLLWEAGDPPASPDSAQGPWRVLAAAFGSPRAAWIARTMTPTNIAERPSTAEQVVSAPAPSFPTPPTRASSYEQAPTTQALPDSWVVVLERDGTSRKVRGAPIAPALAVGLTPRDGTFPEGLPVDAGMRWLVDFDEAEAVGMGVRIPLTDEEATTGFDRVLVFGVRDASADGAGDRTLQQLLGDHHYTDGLALVPQGAPTNNTTDASSAFTTSDPNHAISFAVEVGADLAADASSDGPLLAAALGIPAETFAHVRYADRYGTRNARDMLTALWPGTFGYFVDQMMDPQFNREDEDAMRQFALACVVPRGPLPAMRVGQTPYGVLPTTSLSVLGANRVTRDSEPTQRYRFVLGTLARLLLPAWQASVSDAPHIGASDDPDQDLAQVLGMDASSLAFRARRVVGDDALWNMLAFLDPSGPSEQWWNEHLARGRALLDSLGLSAWDPRVIHTAIGGESYPVPYATVQDAPLSETEPLASDATLNGEAVNYIRWLAHAPMADVWAESYPGTKPTAILYRILRQSMLREYVMQAGRAQIAAGVLAAPALREVELVDLQPAAPTLTARDIVERPVSVGSPVTWAQYLDTLQAPPGSPFARLAELRASMDRLATLPTAELDRTLTETLDAASHRLDVWITALSTSLLAEQRARAPQSPAGTPGEVAPALHLGAYGWVENLRPAEQMSAVTGADAEAVAGLDRDRAKLAGGVPSQPVRLPSEDNGGFIQAPSMTQAAAGAVLRSGYMSHRGTPDEPALAIDLSSSRTRSALWILAGVRQGLSLGALTGFQFEQQLHEANLDVYVQPFREAYPLVGDELHATSASGTVLSPGQVVDGVALRAAWQNGTLAPGQTWGAGLPSPGGPDQASVVGMLEAIDDMLSALGDVSISESVFQIMRGNYGRAGGILNAVSQGEYPPDPDILATPRPGLDVTHRLMLLLAGPPPPVAAWSAVTVRPRALLEPWLSDWVAGRLPDPSTVRAVVSWTYETGAGTQSGTSTVTLRDLDIGPLDVLALADAGQTPQRAELEDRILLAASPPAGASAVTITYSESALPADSTTFADLLTVARSLRDLIGAARPLDLAVFALPDKAPTSGSVDLAELEGRVSALVAALATDTAALQEALAALQADPTSQPDAEALAAVLRTASSYGLPAAIPAPANSAKTLIAQAVRALTELQERQAAVKLSPGTLAELTANATAVLGDSATVLAHQTPPEVASVQAAFAQSSKMQEVEPQALRRWLLQLSHVRPAAQRLDLAFAATRLLGAEGPAIELAQLPLVANDRWLGLPLDPAEPAAAGRVAIEAVCVGDPSSAPAYAGLLVDEWLERIPSATTTAGVSFHYEEPTSRAPQAVLLAACPDERLTWDLGLVQTILDETFELAKCRAVDLASIREVGQILPALYFPFNLQAATPAAHFLEVTEIDDVLR